jgi:hypothetical protein
VLLCFNYPCREQPENAMKKRACFLSIRPLAAPKKNEEAAHPNAGPKKNRGAGSTQTPAIKKNEQKNTLVGPVDAPWA